MMDESSHKSTSIGVVDLSDYMTTDSMSDKKEDIKKEDDKKEDDKKEDIKKEDIKKEDIKKELRPNNLLTGGSNTALNIDTDITSSMSSFLNQIIF